MQLILTPEKLEEIRQERENLFDQIQILKKNSKICPNALYSLEDLHKRIKALDTWLDDHDEETSDIKIAVKQTTPHNVRRELLQNQQEHLLPLFYLMEQGAKIPLKRKNPFAFLWGRHPQVMLARRIYQAALLAEQNLTHIHEVPIRLFLTKFIEESSRPSNRELYRGKFAELFAEFAALMSQLDQEICGLKRFVD